MENALDVLTAYFQGKRLRHGLYRGDAGRAGQQRHFTERLPGFDKSDPFALSITLRVSFQDTFDHDVQGTAHFTLPDYFVPALKLAFHRDFGQPLQLRIR